jgi:hypothetical protein
MPTEKTPLHIQQAEGLRALAAMIEANPDVAKHVAYLDKVNVFHVTEPDAVDMIIRAALRSGAKVTKNWEAPTVLQVGFSWGPVTGQLLSPRESVCERVVTGTETTRKTVPDPAKLADVPLVEVEETVETVEWVCKPLLAAEKDAAVAR